MRIYKRNRAHKLEIWSYQLLMNNNFLEHNYAHTQLSLRIMKTWTLSRLIHHDLEGFAIAQACQLLNILSRELRSRFEIFAEAFIPVSVQIQEVFCFRLSFIIQGFSLSKSYLGFGHFDTNQFGQ